jgi:hypothetical protein
MWVFSAVLITYSAAVMLLDWTRRLDTIEKHWPKASKLLVSRKLSILLLLAGIGLLAVTYGQKPGVQVPTAPLPSTQNIRTGDAKTSGPDSPATTGNGNTFTYDQNSKSGAKSSEKR